METWKDLTIKEKVQLFNGTSLIWAAIILYFVAFLVTLSIGFDVISAGATLLGSGLALFGINSMVKNQMLEFETKVNKKMKQLEEIEEDKRYN